MEIYDTIFKGVQLRLHSSHSDADRILAAAGWRVPTIPEGCKSSSFYFETHEGFHALAVNQRGFTPEASDNEQEVNGCAVIECLDTSIDIIDARRILQEFKKAMVE